MQCNAMQSNPMQCNPMQRIATQCNATQCNATLCNAMQCNAMQYNTIQYNTVQYNTIQYNTIQYNTIQYSTIQYSTIQYNTIQMHGFVSVRCSNSWPHKTKTEKPVALEPRWEGGPRGGAVMEESFNLTSTIRKHYCIISGKPRLHSWCNKMEPHVNNYPMAYETRRFHAAFTRAIQ